MVNLFSMSCQVRIDEAQLGIEEGKRYSSSAYEKITISQLQMLSHRQVTQTFISNYSTNSCGLCALRDSSDVVVVF